MVLCGLKLPLYGHHDSSIRLVEWLRMLSTIKFCPLFCHIPGREYNIRTQTPAAAAAAAAAAFLYQYVLNKSLRLRLFCQEYEVCSCCDSVLYLVVVDIL